jgi:hypothetical protein
MPEPARVVSSNQPLSPGYRPLSVLALVAFATAAIYSVIVGALAVVAFSTGKTLFLPLWLVLFPAVAVGAALIARLQIRRSEGTLGGGALASWAWWLGTLFGLGFLAFYFATYLAVGKQAKDFSELWLSKLRDGKMTEAFLLTQEPAVRKFDKASDKEAILERYGVMPLRGRKGPLAAFEDREIVRIFLQGGPKTQFSSLGVKNWQYDKGGYKVWQTYMIVSPLGAWDVQVTVQSAEGPEFEGRQWSVALNDVAVTGKTDSPLGMAIDVFRKHSRSFIRDWIFKLADNNLEGAYLDTCEFGKRETLKRSFYARRAAHRVAVAGSVAATVGCGTGPAANIARLTSLVNPLLESLEYLNGCRELLSGALVHSDNLAVVKKYRDEVIRNLTNQFGHPAGLDIEPQDSTPHYEPVEQNATGQVELSHDVRIQLYPGKNQDADPQFLVDASVVVQNDPEGLEMKSGSLDLKRLAWRVVKIKLLQANVPPPAERKPGGGVEPKPPKFRERPH